MSCLIDYFILMSIDTRDRLHQIRANIHILNVHNVQCIKVIQTNLYLDVIARETYAGYSTGDRMIGTRSQSRERALRSA